jgi:hypothetical protein
MSNNLKPCPFCGQEAVIHSQDSGVCACDNNSCNMNLVFFELSAWNTRHEAAKEAGQPDEMPHVNDKWKEIKPSIEAQRIRSALLHELDSLDTMPEYTVDLVDITAQLGINSTKRESNGHAGKCAWHIDYTQCNCDLFKQESGGWQPIETAPKDGTRVIIVLDECNQERWVDIAKYGKERPLGCHTNWQNGYGQGYSWRPTHWMPLPKPPLSKIEGGE